AVTRLTVTTTPINVANMLYDLPCLFAAPADVTSAPGRGSEILVTQKLIYLLCPFVSQVIEDRGVVLDIFSQVEISRHVVHIIVFYEIGRASCRERVWILVVGGAGERKQRDEGQGRGVEDWRHVALVLCTEVGRR